MKNFPVLGCGILLILAAVFGFCSSSASSGHEDPDEDHYIPSHMITSPFIPDKVDFAGESMPLEYFDVRESLERELIVNMNFHSNTLQCIKRANRFFPVIEPILKEYNIPDDFKYLSLIESDFMNKVSPRGATGFWQFMKGAAQDYGLEVNSEVDERYHIEKSTIAACKYLKEAYDIFENWTMAAASYNMGKAGLGNQVKRQKNDYYYDLLLNEETMRYVYRIAAVKLIFSDPEKYGYLVLPEDKYPVISYTGVEVKTAVANWTDFAIKHQTNYKMLKYLNPWLRDIKLTNPKQKSYTIRIPTERFRGDSSHQIDEQEAEQIEKESEQNKKRDITQ